MRLPLLMGVFLVACEPPAPPPPAISDTEHLPSTAAGPAASAGWRSPAVACGYLASEGMPTRGYKQQYEDSYGCSSDYLTLVGGGAPPNNLAYYVGGGSAEARELKLVLNVNTRAAAENAHAALLARATRLTEQALGAPLPEPARVAIRAGQPGTWTVAGRTLTVARDDWPTGRGYEVHVLIR